MYALIVIGAGPGGYEAAARAGQMGRKVALIEREYLGGACLNVGCIPAKAFLKSSKLFAEVSEGARYGVVTEGARFDLATVVERKNRLVATLTRGVEGLLKRSGVEVLRGHARLLSRGKVQVGADSYEAGNILIATGSRPAVPPIPGIASPQVLDSTGILSLTEVPGQLAIIGGGYIGLEFASFFSAIGSQATVFEMLPHVAAGCDLEISRRLEQELRRSGVEIKTSSKVTGIEGGALHYQDAAGTALAHRADCILNATGRSPVVEDLGLEQAGVDFDARGIKTSDQGRTSVPGIWACGDVTGRRLLAHAATREGLVAVGNMFGRGARIRYEAIPAIIYTHPEVAAVGATEEELKAQGVQYRKAVVPMSIAGRFLVENEKASGMVKALVGARYGEILGVHAVGDLSSEFIVLAAAMIETEMRAADVEELVFPHPTVSEALKAAIMQAAP